MNITTNQNRQMYVASAYSATVNGSSATGTIGAVKAVDDVLGKEFYFLYKGADTVLKSDRIKIGTLGYAKAFKASDLIVPLKKVKIALDANINSGNPVSGQDYELTIHLPGFYTDSAIEDYYKYGVVHATAAMAADKKLFYKAMVASLNANFSREVDATATSNPYLTFSAGTAGSEDGIYITAKEPAWTLGTEQQRFIDFEALPQTIYTGGDDVIWGVVTDQTPTKANAVAGSTGVGNGKKIADLEYFCMGERGDQYRGMGFPNTIDTKYLVDPTKEYNVLELHFAFTDSGVNSYRSEKDITVVFPMGAASHEYDQINAFIGAINSAAGTSIATLS
jgi:hypothetical protein